MADETDPKVDDTEETDVVVEDDDTEDKDAWDEDRARKALNKKNQENKSLRDRLKQLKEYEAKMKDEEDKNKSSEERFAEVAQAKTKVERDLWRATAAWSAGLTPAQAKRLVGDTPEELAEDAKALAEELGLTQEEDDIPAPRRRPKELRGGASPDEDAPLDIDAIVASIPRR